MSIDFNDGNRQIRAVNIFIIICRAMIGQRLV